ncbi:MAG: SIMPL domain-containing protein [Parahaliea sp.]
MKKHISQRIVLLLLLLLSTFSQAQEKALAQIRVSGQGSVSLIPDTAQISLTVTRQADTAAEALAANSQAMDKVLSAMKEAGIADQDLQTSGFGIEPRYIYPEQRGNSINEPKLVDYFVRNTLNVRVRTIEHSGSLLDTAVKSGVNAGGHISFSHSNPAPAFEQARTLAIKNALAKAKTLAEAANVRLGKIISISEGGSHQLHQPLFASHIEAVSGASDVVPIAKGEQNYSVEVELSIAIEQ